MEKDVISRCLKGKIYYHMCVRASVSFRLNIYYNIIFYFLREVHTTLSRVFNDSVPSWFVSCVFFLYQNAIPMILIL